MEQSVKSSTLKFGKRTFFFDVKVASNKKHYLKLTESAFQGEGQDRRRNSLVIFPEEVQSFQEKLAEATKDLN